MFFLQWIFPSPSRNIWLIILAYEVDLKMVKMNPTVHLVNGHFDRKLSPGYTDTQTQTHTRSRLVTLTLIMKMISYHTWQLNGVLNATTDLADVSTKALESIPHFTVFNFPRMQFYPSFSTSTLLSCDLYCSLFSSRAFQSTTASPLALNC